MLPHHAIPDQAGDLGLFGLGIGFEPEECRKDPNGTSFIHPDGQEMWRTSVEDRDDQADRSGFPTARRQVTMVLHA
jgi:hypothetical protein